MPSDLALSLLSSFEVACKLQSSEEGILTASRSIVETEDFKDEAFSYINKYIAEVIFKLYRTENSTVIEGECEVGLRSWSLQPPVKYIKCDRLQPRIEPVT